MRATVTVVQALVRLLFGVLLILGIAFWSGRWLGLIPLHMALGVALVLCLWITSSLAAIARVPVGPAIAGIVLGMLVVALGVTQMQLLAGSSHWIVQVVHLLFGMAAIGLNERLARLTKDRLATASR